MSNTFNLAMAAAYRASQKARGVVVSIKVSSVLTLSDITVVPAETIRDELGEDNEVISRRVQDWLIKASDCDGNEPKESWEITRGSDVFKLIPYDEERAFRYHDVISNTIYRVHSVLISGSAG